MRGGPRGPGSWEPGSSGRGSGGPESRGSGGKMRPRGSTGFLREPGPQVQGVRGARGPQGVPRGGQGGPGGGPVCGMDYLYIATARDWLKVSDTGARGGAELGPPPTPEPKAYACRRPLAKRVELGVSIHNKYKICVESGVSFPYTFLWNFVCMKVYVSVCVKARAHPPPGWRPAGGDPVGLDPEKPVP